MQAYHASNSVSSGGYSDNPVRNNPDVRSNPYAIIPPIGQLLDRLCAELSVGGCMRPGNRTIADWLGLASAGSIPGLIAQLVSDGWIAYDRTTSMITLLRSMHAPKKPKRPRLSATDYQAQYRSVNRAKLLEKSRAYAAGHRTERSASYHAAIARRRGDNGRWTADEWRAMCAWFGSACLCCGSPEITVDHVIPKGRRHGGKNVIANLQPLCKACNLQKHNAVIDYRDPDRLAAFLESIDTPDQSPIDRSILPISRSPGNRSIDRIDRDLAHQDAADLPDRSPKPTESACMVLATASTHESSQDLAVGYGGMQGGDLPRDRPPPAAQLMAELGANPAIIRDAYAARPDWTPQQVRDRWEYDQRRMSASDGRLTAGIFFTALRSGELAPDTRPIDPQSYAGRDDVMLGSDLPPAETIRDRALSLLGPWTAENHQAQIRDSVFLQCRLASGDSDADALHALAEHRKRVRR